MSIRYQSFSVTGVANSTVEDGGITSTVDEPILVRGIHVTVSVWVGNTLEGWIAQTRHLQIRDRVIDTYEASGTNQFQSIDKANYFAIGRALDIGQTFLVAINSGGTLSSIEGAYEFEVIGD